MTSPEEQLQISEAAFDLIAPVLATAAYLTLVVDNIETLDDILDDVQLDHPAWGEGMKDRMRGDFTVVIKRARDALDSIEEKIA